MFTLVTLVTLHAGLASFPCQAVHTKKLEGLQRANAQHDAEVDACKKEQAKRAKQRLLQEKEEKKLQADRDKKV